MRYRMQRMKGVVKVIQQDLEALLGLVSTADDPTKLVYQLLKDTPHKKSLLQYRKLCSDSELERRLEEVAKGYEKAKSSCEKDNRRPSFAKWLSGQGSSVPLPGDVQDS